MVEGPQASSGLGNVKDHPAPQPTRGCGGASQSLNSITPIKVDIVKFGLNRQKTKIDTL